MAAHPSVPPEAPGSADQEPLAVVGIGCRFPGGVRDLQTLGGVLMDGADLLRAVPEDRWDRQFHDPQATRPGTAHNHTGAFLDDIDRFDAEYFGISPREARALDPQQRILLEVAWEAMSDSGRPREAWRGTRTAVFIGMLANDYATLHAKTLGPPGIGPHYASGLEFSFAAGRVAHTFDLRGPAATLNSACSSSLLAVHLAGQSLRSGEADIALAGGVSLLITPELSIFMSGIGAVSPTGACRPFDAAADGVVRGEGCGVVVLRRLRDALACGDRVHAVILGSAVNHDGSSMGLTAPSAAAQAEVLSAALARAGVGPDGIDYVEAHGTGTPLGDQIELKTLADIYGPARQPDGPLLIGSHKAVFGHMDAAAGIAGLLKAIWVVTSGHAPGQPRLGDLVPAVDWPRAGIAVRATGSTLTESGRPLRAGVSAFGLSGTNAHVIVAAAAARSAAPRTAPGPSDDRGPLVLLMSAPHREGLAAQVSAMRSRLADAAADGRGAVADLVRSAATRRTQDMHRCAVVADDHGGLDESLAAWPSGVITGTAEPGQAAAPVLVYSGQGSQWPGMAADLYDDAPSIRETLDECDALIRRHVSWSLLDEIRRSRDSRLGDTDRAQPAIFAVQVALSRWLLARGIAPAALIGHSVGEVAAAHVAGCLTLADAVGLVVQRGLLLHETAGTGAMAAVSGDEATVGDILARTGLPVVIAAVNGPASVVVAGPAASVRAAIRAAEDRGLSCMQLPVSYAFHSPLVAACGPRLRALLDRLAPAAPSIRLLSSVTPLADLSRPDAAYWERNLIDPVRLWPAVDRLLAERDAMLIEISPHPVLSRPLSEALGIRSRRGPVVTTLRRGRPGLLGLHEALARMHVAGAAIRWDQVTGTPGQYRGLPVPSWGGERYWLPGVRRGQQGAGPTATPPARVRLSFLDDAGNVTGEMVAQPRGMPPSGDGAAGAAPAETGRPVHEITAPAGDPAGAAGRAAAPPSAADRVETAARHVLGLDPGHPLPRRRGLFELGLDSMTAVELRGRLETDFGVPLQTTVAFEHPTIEELAAHLSELEPAAASGGAPAPDAAAGSAAPGTAAAAGPGPAIAVVGLACRLPGARSPDEFWALLRDGADMAGAIPQNRRDDPIWAEAGPDVPTHGGYLDDVAGFDAPFFRISPREARSLDPQQRLFLEVAWEALEDAGLQGHAPRRPVGVYLGMNTADYQQLLTRNMSSIDLYYGTGTAFAAAAGRLSYFLGLNGPSIALDTACSASLTAVHLACQGLREGDCEAAVVGGVNIIAAPTVSAAMSAGGALAPDGRCKTFDEAADGYGRGEGAAVIILKPLAAAQRDGDRIYAVIAGSAVNQDGASGGLTVPSGPAQAAVIRRALGRAGWAPADVDYVEAHGTGTPLGDPIEVRALADALGPGRSDTEPLLIGSVKANIGHLEAAAGAAGLLKVILALHHGHIPAHRVTRPSSRIGWARLPVAIATAQAWPDRGRPARAGVSAFGFTGSNAHVLVEQAPRGPEPARVPAGPPYVLMVTAASEDALAAASGRLAERLRAAAPAELDGIVLTASRRRTWLEYRLAVIGDDAAELADALATVATGGETARARRGHVPDGQLGELAFWYGDDWPGQEIAGRLAAIPAYARALATCADEITAATGGQPDLCAEPPPGLRQVWVFSHHVAASSAWSAAGIAPGGTVGIGAGEITAAWAAGQLTMTGAVRLLMSDPAARTGNGDLLRRTAVPLAPRARPAPGETAQRLEAAGFRTVVEPTLRDLPEPVAARLGVPVGSGDPVLAIASTAAELFATGRARALEPGARPGRPPVSLPAYPWQRRRHWYGEQITGHAAAAITATEPDDRLFMIKWEQIPAPAERGGPPGAWAVLGRGALAGDLAAVIEKRGHVVTQVTAPPGGDGEDGWRRCLEELDPGCRGVVFAAGPAAPASPAGAAPSRAPEPAQDALDALAIGQAMAALRRPPGRLWFVTQRADNPDDPDDADVNPAHTAVWEVGRVLAMELPDRWGGLVDTGGDAEMAARALQAAAPEDQLIARAGRWHAARLVRAAGLPRERDAVDEARWHVVAGGADAGPAVSALIACGARRLLLAGEVPPPEAGAAGGGTVTVERCELAELPDRLARQDPAGDIIIVGGPVPTAALASVTGADAAGRLAGAAPLARVCLAASQHRPQRLTVVLSAAPSWGSVNAAAVAGPAGWIAGHARRAAAAGTPVSVLALMPRAGTGELAEEHRALFEQSGLRCLEPAEVQELLCGTLLGRPAERSAAVVDLRRYVRLCQDLAPRGFLSQLADVARAPALTQTRTMLLALPPVTRGERLLDHVIDTVTGVLGLGAGELDPDRGFFDLGMDSVLALAVRSRLEDDLGVELSSTLTFEYPTALQLAGHLGRLLDEQPGPADRDTPLETADDELVEALDRSIAAANRELPPAGSARWAEET